MREPIIPFCAAVSLTTERILGEQRRLGARYPQSLLSRRGRSAASRERAIPRANVDRFQATASYARRLFRLVKCSVSALQPRPATPGT